MTRGRPGYGLIAIKAAVLWRPRVATASAKSAMERIMLVREVMSAPVITIDPRATLRSAIQKMLDAHLSALPVVDGAGKLVGIVSEADLLHRTEIGTENKRPRWLEFLLGPGRSAAEYTHSQARYVEEIMTPDPVTIGEDASLDDAVKSMESRKIKRIPVMRGEALVGIVSRSDMLRALMKSGKLMPDPSVALGDPEIAEAIRREINAQKWSTPDAIKIVVAGVNVTLNGTIFDERERDAIRVCAENVPGVKTVVDNLIWIDPESGTYLGPPGSGIGSV